MNNYNKFLDTYYGKDLLKKHTLHEYGIWQVHGEDPNCDLGGHHHQPDLGIYEGTLIDVITVAVELPHFWSWGAGGNIIKKNIEKIDSTTAAIRKEKRTKLKALEEEVAKLRKDLSLS